MDDVAREVGILKGSLYYHFESKQQLRDAYLARELQKRLGWLDELAGRGPDPRGQLLAVIEGHRAWVAAADFRGCFLQNATVEYPGDPAVADLARWYWTHTHALLSDRFAKGGASDPASTSRQLLVLLHGAITASQLGEVDSALHGCDAASALVLEQCTASALAVS